MSVYENDFANMQKYKKFLENLDNFITKDAKTFYFRNAMQGIYDETFLPQIEQIMEKTKQDLSAKQMDDMMFDLQKLCDNELSKVSSCKTMDEKLDTYQKALAYFFLIEALNENSSFSEGIVKDIKDKFKEKYLEVLAKLDKKHLSQDAKIFGLKQEEKQILENNESHKEEKLCIELEKYLLMKKWQDIQREYYEKHIDQITDFEKEYIDHCETNLIKIHHSTLIKRAMKSLVNMGIVPIELVAKYHLVNIDQDLLKVVGGKGLGLAKIYACCINIPKTFVIPVGANISKIDFAKYLDPTKKYAIRSSADIEDGQNHSFAGMFDSYLDIDFANVKEYVQKVLDSVNNQRVEKYVEINKLESPKMAVVIQEFITPTYSGVWIGQNDSSGTLEWVKGDGEKLVSGMETPNQEIWENNTLKKKHEKEDVLKIQDEYIGTKLIQIQNTLCNDNEVADMEWCIIEDELVMLQYRPVTRKVEVFKQDTKPLSNSEFESKIFRGSPASSGKILGPCAYYRNVDDIQKWNDGDILISLFTDPNWMDIMARSSALVTAVGGLLCHSAIIARELGIPCVTGIGRDTLKQLQDAKEIYVDADNGIVCTKEVYEKYKENFEN